MSSSPTETATPREVRNFGLVVGSVLVLLGALRWYRRGPGTAVWALLAAGLVLAVLCVIAPGPMSPVYLAWMRLAEALAWINTRIILVIVFYLVVTPLSWIMRLAGRRPISLEQRDSYWRDTSNDTDGDRHFERQF